MRGKTISQYILMMAAVLLACSQISGNSYAGPFGKTGKGGGGGGSTGPRIISFAGYDWLVKSSTEAVGPGPNNFSASTQSVWVDDIGRLHLMIRRDRKRWYCAEVICQESFGHGRYEFRIDSPLDALDLNVVLGLFTWDSNAPEFAYREIDIEIARWGNAARSTNAQYVVQPFDAIDHMYRWTQTSVLQSTHSFEWAPDSVWFQSLSGHRSFADTDDQHIAEYEYIGDDVPPAGGENPRINLWLTGGNAPLDRSPVEIIISDFTFQPLN